MAEVRPSKPFMQRFTTASKWLIPYYRADVQEYIGNQINTNFQGELSDYPLIRIKRIDMLILPDNNVRACNFPYYGFVTFKGTAIHGRRTVYFSSSLYQQTSIECDLLLSPEKLDLLEAQIQMDNRCGDSFVTLADDLAPVPEMSVFLQVYGEYIDL